MTKTERTPALQAAALMVWLVGITAATACDTTAHPQPATTGTTSRISTDQIHAAPAHLKSVIFHGITLPVADQGPHHDDGTVADGYERSPVGAALAAIQATVRMSVADDSQFARIGIRMIASGSARREWGVARAQKSITTSSKTPPVLLGYRVRTYSPDSAEIEIYTRQPDNSLTCNTARVVWQSNDWKLLLPNAIHEKLVTVVSATPADMTSLRLR